MKRGFTLIELLVTVGIIAALIAILLPTLSRVRTQSQRVACRAALADVGRFFNMYLNDSRNRLPLVNPLPSFQPPLNAHPSIVQVLEPYVKDSVKIWQCNSDRIIALGDPGFPTGFSTYFEREGASYAYNEMLATLYGGRPLNDHPMFQRNQMNRLRVFNDYEPFHGKAGTQGAMNYLFADWHVGDLE